MKLLEKGKKLHSILYLKCPYCHEGEFFITRNFYDFRYRSAAHESCPDCKRRLYIEPGFYFGAMYVSYGLGLVHLGIIWAFQQLLGIEVEFWNFVIIAGLSLLAVTPIYFGLSKIIWANLFFNYKGIE